MSPELEEKLIKNYPILFKNIGKSPMESCMAFGIEFGDGWYKIFDELCEYITRLCSREDLYLLKKEFITEENRGFLYVKRPNVVFDQVKEKFGTTRIYWSSEYPDNWGEICEKTVPGERERFVSSHCRNIDACIDYVEFLSSKVCEVCGQPGKASNKGWIKVRCENCK